jgi:hypothetical protein
VAAGLEFVGAGKPPKGKKPFVKRRDLPFYSFHGGG